ncbi:NOV [Symbiodinium pilosum]|uniref:NOV protein n=1 Tax=Symbiodinium pilosum TaxID=2952 RepID=A0A812QCA5_SYMPI|nr:NOV [Symbiodinium pilosum]
MFLQVRTHFNQVQHVPSSATAQVSQVREGVQRLSDSLCAAVERLANDLYESECHFLYEIVQNAEDAHARARPEEPLTSQILAAPGMLLLPAGLHGDVTALCDISASSKKKPLPGAAGKSIGKGIGFKSVFTVSDRAHVLSKGFTFVFDVQGPLGKLGYVTPTWSPGRNSFFHHAGDQGRGPH